MPRHIVHGVFDDLISRTQLLASHGWALTRLKFQAMAKEFGRLCRILVRFVLTTPLSRALRNSSLTCSARYLCLKSLLFFCDMRFLSCYNCGTSRRTMFTCCMETYGTQKILQTCVGTCGPPPHFSEEMHRGARKMRVRTIS